MNCVCAKLVNSRSVFWIWLVTATLVQQAMASEPKPDVPEPDVPARIVIAHRGACGYLPEHTLESAALAYGMGAHFIEQDVVLTKDDQPVVLHDIHLDTVTNVAELFPARRRNDQRYYAIDFTLAEIKSLRVTERIDLKTNAAVFAGRFPVRRGSFQVSTLAEQIELVQGLNRSTRRDVGIYPEIKSPAWHRAEHKDISLIVLQVLRQYGYRDKSDNVFLQCFDVSELQRIRNQLGCGLKLIQLIGENDWNESGDDFARLRTSPGLREVAQYADGIGPWLPHVVQGRNDQGVLQLTALVEQAHDCGLAVHPYTVRADQVPGYADSFEQLLQLFLIDAKVDGVFTDFPDQVVSFLDQHPRRPQADSRRSLGGSEAQVREQMD